MGDYAIHASSAFAPARIMISEYVSCSNKASLLVYTTFRHGAVSLPDAATLKLDILLTLFMWSEWVTSGLRALCPGGLAKPRPVIQTNIGLTFTLGKKKVLIWDDSCSRRRFNRPHAIQNFYRLTWRSHYIFSLYSRTTMFQTIMCMPAISGSETQVCMVGGMVGTDTQYSCSVTPIPACKVI